MNTNVHKLKRTQNYICILISAFVAGCGGNIIKPKPICPGKNNVTESLAALQSQSENMIPLYTNKGKFSIELYDYDKEELQKQHLNIRILLIKPPSEIYVQANAGVAEKAMILGSNAQEFWLQIKPISTYWWGKWSDQDEDAGIIINPKTVLEALGIAEIDTNANWSLSNEGPYDILTKTENGIIRKKLFIYCCDYRVDKIEYYDRYGKPIVLAKLDKYEEVSTDFFIPFSIEINSMSKNIEDTFNVEIKLDSVKPATEQQKHYKIDLPKTPSLDHIYQVINGEQIEQ